MKPGWTSADPYKGSLPLNSKPRDFSAADEDGKPAIHRGHYEVAYGRC